MPYLKRPRKLEEVALFDYAMKTLAARAQPAGELRDKLRRRAARMADVETVMGRLRAFGYINDKQYAEEYATRRLENEGFGRARVLADLRARRIAPALAERAVKQVFAGVDETALIEQFLERKFRRQPLREVLADEKGVASVYRKLRGAGFSSGNAIRVLKRHVRDIEDLDRLADSEDPSASAPEAGSADPD